MINLAGVKDCDVTIRIELTRCGIEVVEAVEPCGREVNARLSGRLDTLHGVFTFRRAWYYWVVEGSVPLALAKKIYEHPICRTDVRAGGDCACRPPALWASYFDADGQRLVRDPDGDQERMWDSIVADHPDWKEFQKKPRFVADPADVAARAVVDVYHIDSELGLYLFVAALRGEFLNE